MNVAAVQFKPRPKGDKDAALAALAGLAAQAAPGRELVVLPEMAATGYIFTALEAVRAVAEAPDGPTFQALAPVAAAHGCWLVVGFPEAAGELVYNSAMVIDPSGTLAFCYRKTLLYEADLPWATPGDSGYRRFDTRTGSFTVGICMDLNDDAFVAWCRESGVRAIAFPTNWIDEGHDVWPYWAWRCEEGPALIAANTYGEDEGVRFSGRSAIIDGRRVLGWTDADGDAVVVATLPS